MTDYQHRFAKLEADYLHSSTPQAFEEIHKDLIQLLIDIENDKDRSNYAELRNKIASIGEVVNSIMSNDKKIELYAYARSFTCYPLLDRFNISIVDFVDSQWAAEGYPEATARKRISDRMNSLYQLSSLIGTKIASEKEIVDYYKATFYNIEKTKEHFKPASTQEEKIYTIKCEFSGNRNQLAALRAAVEANHINFKVMK